MPQRYVPNPFPLPYEVFELGLSHGPLLVYIYLQYQKDARSDQCWPSYATIGAAVGMSRKTVQKHIGVLIDKLSCFISCPPPTFPFFCLWGIKSVIP